jgi:hypothetical protein
LDEFLAQVASKFPTVIPKEKISDYVKLWKEKLGKFVGQVQNLRTLVLDPIEWAKIDLDPPIKATITELLKSSAKAGILLFYRLYLHLVAQSEQLVTHLDVGDFLPFVKLPVIATDLEGPKTFIRKQWCVDQITEIMNQFRASDGQSVGTRVAPMALVAHSGAGKTRSLSELARSLRVDHKISTIFISFNSSTPYIVHETTNALDSVLSRIAYAIAKPDIKGDRALHDDDGKLQFVSTATAIGEWLGKTPCVLCIDELNRLMTDGIMDPERVVARFLKQNFYEKANRYLIFTSHVISTASDLTSYYVSASGSDRSVLVSDIPVFESTDEFMMVFEDEPDCHPMIYGNSPGLAYIAENQPRNRLDYCEDRVRKVLKSIVSVSALDLIENIFSGSCLKLNELDTLTRVSGGERIWIPIFLKYLFDDNKLTQIDDNHRERLVKLLAKLGTAKVYSGESWELVVLCALYFRILKCLLSNRKRIGDEEDDDEDDEVDCYWIPKLPRTEFVIAYQRPSKDIEAVMNSLSVRRSSPCAVLCYPKQSGFPIYDILIAVTTSQTDPVVIWGYQCKAGDLPENDPLPSVDCSIVLRSHDVDARESRATDAGWNVAGQDVRKQLLGPTFLPLRLLEISPGEFVDKTKILKTNANSDTSNNNLEVSRENETRKEERKSTRIGDKGLAEPSKKEKKRKNSKTNKDNKDKKEKKDESEKISKRNRDSLSEGEPTPEGKKKHKKNV